MRKRLCTSLILRSIVPCTNQGSASIVLLHMHENERPGTEAGRCVLRIGPRMLCTSRRRNECKSELLYTQIVAIGGVLDGYQQPNKHLFNAGRRGFPVHRTSFSIVLRHLLHRHLTQATSLEATPEARAKVAGRLNPRAALMQGWVLRCGSCCHTGWPFANAQSSPLPGKCLRWQTSYSHKSQRMMFG